MELVKQGWLVRGNIVFASEADADGVRAVAAGRAAARRGQPRCCRRCCAASTCSTRRRAVARAHRRAGVVRDVGLDRRCARAARGRGGDARRLLRATALSWSMRLALAVARSSHAAARGSGDARRPARTRTTARACSRAQSMQLALGGRRARRSRAARHDAPSRRRLRRRELRRLGHAASGRSRRRTASPRYAVVGQRLERRDRRHGDVARRAARKLATACGPIDNPSCTSARTAACAACSSISSKVAPGRALPSYGRPASGRRRDREARLRARAGRAARRRRCPRSLAIHGDAGARARADRAAGRGRATRTSSRRAASCVSRSKPGRDARSTARTASSARRGWSGSTRRTTRSPTTAGGSASTSSRPAPTTSRSGSRRSRRRGRRHVRVRRADRRASHGQVDAQHATRLDVALR